MALVAAASLSGVSLGDLLRDYPEDFKEAYHLAKGILTPLDLPLVGVMRNKPHTPLRPLALRKVEKTLHYFADAQLEIIPKKKSPRHLEKLLLSVELPPLQKEHEITYSLDKILDLGRNISDWKLVKPAKVSYARENYANNRSQISRLSGGISPPHVMEKCKTCDLQIPKYL